MARPRSISIKQIVSLLSLYADDVPIKEIMKRTGIRSEQTVYRILDENGIKRRLRKRCPIKMTISFEDDVKTDILEHSSNVSAFVCECIRKAREYDKVANCPDDRFYI